MSFEFWINGKLSKIGLYFSTIFFKMILSEMSITKNVLLDWYSSMKKKLRKIQMIFEIEN